VLTTLPFAKLRLENRAWKFALIRIINIVLNISLNLFFFLICPYWIEIGFAPSLTNLVYQENIGIGFIFISNFIASLGMFLLLLPEIVKIKAQFDLQIWKKMWNYSFPILVGGLAYVTNEMVDKLLLEYLLPRNVSTSQVGIYSACYKISIFMTLFVQAFRYGAEPFFFAQAKSSNAQEKYAEVMRYFVAFGCFIFLVINVFIDFLKHFIQDTSYHEGLKVVPILLMANLFLGVYYNLSVWYKVTEKTKFGAYISLIGAAITISLNILLIPSMSYVGSAWATLICYSSMCLMSYTLGHSHYPIAYDWKSIFFYLSTSVGLFFFWLAFSNSSFLLGFLVCVTYIILIFVKERWKTSTSKV
jgi:O-antigen/teichoic acid export membrane protein